MPWLSLLSPWHFCLPETKSELLNIEQMQWGGTHHLSFYATELCVSEFFLQLTPGWLCLVGEALRREKVTSSLGHWSPGEREREREIWIFLLTVGQKSRKTWKPRKGGWRTGSARGRAGEQHGPSHQMWLRSEGAPRALFKARQTCCWIFCFLTPAWDAARCCGSCMEKPQTVEQPFSATLFPVWRTFFFPDGFRSLKFWNKSALTPTLKNANKLFNNEAPEEESLLKT